MSPRSERLARRRLLQGGVSAIGLGLLAGCDRLTRDVGPTRSLLDLAEGLNYRLQRLLLGADRLAPEYAEADITGSFKPNGTTDPADRDYKKLAAAEFAPFRLAVDGLVETPASFSLSELRALPSRTQITRHDCVEGWSCIGQWTGVPLSVLLDRVKPKPEARFVVIHCADTMPGGGLDGGSALEGGDNAEADDDAEDGEPVPKGPRYYESIDFADARHPQTILAYDMNGAALPVRHGAPLRLRVERQLGYKMAKYVMRIELVDNYAKIGGGRGSYWADNGYDWFAGI